MPTFVAITPTYASGDIAKILEIEQRQIEDTIADLNEEQMCWRPNPKAKSALEIVWHIGYAQTAYPRPQNKAEALQGLRHAYAELQRDIETPGKLEEPVRWHTGDMITYRGVIWGMIRHRSYHLGELVYLRQAMGLDEPKYYHEE